MPSPDAAPPKLALRSLTLLIALACAATLVAQEAPSASAPPVSSTPAPIERPEMPAPPPPPPPISHYDPALFQNKIPAADLADLTRFAGTPTGTLFADKQFRKLVHSITPNCMYHYGRDMSLSDALDLTLDHSQVPILVRDNRYVLLGGVAALYPGLRGRGFVWIDTQAGILLGGFFFRPTNGEPSPTLTVFSKQVREPDLTFTQLPPEFGVDLTTWTMQTSVPLVTTRYFIGDLKQRILLEHDEDFCAIADRAPIDDCEQANADAADDDLVAAQYLADVNYRTNATAYMINGADRAAWLQVVDTTCGIGPAALPCRIRITRQRTHKILKGRM
jgi:hypothetical protein